MKINIDIDENYNGTSIQIKTNVWTEELEDIVTIIKKDSPQRLFGIAEDQTILIHPSDIDFVYTEQRKVYAALESRNIEIKMKLYEVEQLLTPHHFSRFSKSVIGNLNHIKKFELAFNGNLCVYFHSGNKEYISRKYVSTVKEKLMMGGAQRD